MRTSKQLRETKETKVELELNIDGAQKYEISTGIKFFDHMLEQFAHHSGFDLKIKVTSHDLDPHHCVEDVALTLGNALKEALGDKRGITRYSSVILPMDEALVLSAIDISGRAFCSTQVDLKDRKTSDFETVLLAHFFNSFAQNAGLTLHVKKLDGSDTHHIIEAAFKATARALKQAVAIDAANKNEIPSTKGVL